MGVRLLLTTAALLALLPAAPAFAQNRPAGQLSESSKQRARDAMHAGRAKMKAGQNAAALADFRIADEIVAVPSTRVAVAQALSALGRLKEARDAAASVEQMPAKRYEPKALVAARKQARELVTEIDGRMPQLTLQLAGVDAGAAVTIKLDGAAVTRQELAAGMALDPGEHRLTVSAPERMAQERKVVLKEGQRETLKLTLMPVEQEAPEEGGAISPLLWAGVGVAGAGLVLGGVMGGLALSKNNGLNERCTLGDGDDCPPDLREERDTAVTYAHVSTAGFALAGAGAVLGVVGFLLSGGDSTGVEQAQVVPLVGPGFVGVGGRF